MTKATRRGKILLKLCSLITVLTEGSQDSNSKEAGAGVETMEDAEFWLTSPALLSLLSYRTQDHQPKDGTTHNGLGLPPLVSS